MSESYEKAISWMNEAQHRFRLFQWYFNSKKDSMAKDQAVKAVNESWKALNLFEEGQIALAQSKSQEASSLFQTSYNSVQKALNVLHAKGTAVARNQGYEPRIAWIKQIISNYYYQFQMLYKFYTEFHGYSVDMLKDSLRHIGVMSDYLNIAGRDEATNPAEALGRYELALANLMEAILYLNQTAEREEYIKIKV